MAPDASAISAVTATAYAAALEAVPPCDLDAERAVLGAALLDPDALADALRLLRPGDFADAVHARLLAELGEIAAGLEPGERLDLVVGESALRAAGVLEELGGRAFLMELVDACPAVCNIGAYCQIVRRAAVQRAAYQMGLELARRVAQPQADPAAVLADVQEQVGRLMARVRPAGGKSLRQVVAENPEMRAAVVHGLLRQGETANLIAPSKTGKSWLASALALDVATGRPFLGLYPTERGDVLLVDNELHGETIANRIPRVAAALGIPLADAQDHVFIENLRGRSFDIYALRDYLADVQPGRFGLIVLDALFRLLPRDSDENSNADVQALYNVIDGLADRLASGFVLVHHSTKGSQSLKSVTDVGAGAGAQSRAADTHLVLRAHEEEGAFVLDAAARSWPPIEPVCLRWVFPAFTVAPDLDPKALRPDRPRRPKKPKEPAPPVKTWTVKGFVAAFLTEHPKARAATIEAACAAGLSANRAKGLLAAAEAEGLAYRWTFGPARPVKFATTEQPAPEGGS